MRGKLVVYYIGGFATSFLLFMFSLIFFRIVSITQFFEIFRNKDFLFFNVLFALLTTLILYSFLSRIGKGVKERREVDGVLKRISYVPRSFLLLIFLYQALLPIILFIEGFLSSLSALFIVEITAIGIVLIVQPLFFLKVDSLISEWTVEIELEHEKSMDLPTKLYLLLGGSSVGLLLLTSVVYVTSYPGVNSGTNISFIFPVIAALLLSAIFINKFVIRTLVGPLKDLTKALKSFSEGRTDEDVTLSIRSRDEVGKLAFWFNRFSLLVKKRREFKKIIEDDRDISSVYRRLYSFLKEDFGFKDVTIYEVNNSKNHMRIVAGGGDKSWCSQDILIDISRCRAVRTADMVESFSRKNMCFSFKFPNEKRHVCLPVIVGGYIGNVVQIVFDPSTPYKKVKRDVDRLRTLLEDVSSVIEAKRLLEQLRESSFRDALTGLYNRKFLREYIDILVRSAKRKHSYIGLLMCDIDHFKKVNDLHGHDAGDEILKRVAEILQDEVRSSDLVVRYGGEEFLIVLNETEEKGAMEVAERVREAVKNARYHVEEAILNVTVSIGVSVFPADADNIWECIKYADIALYRAKETGRDKVVRFQHSLREPTKALSS